MSRKKTPKMTEADVVKRTAEANLDAKVLGDDLVQVTIAGEHREIANNAAQEFFEKLSGFNGVEITTIMTGMLSQWLSMHCDTGEQAIQVMSLIASGVSTTLGHATKQGLTNWSKPPEGEPLN